MRSPVSERLGPVHAQVPRADLAVIPPRQVYVRFVNSISASLAQVGDTTRFFSRKDPRSENATPNATNILATLYR